MILEAMGWIGAVCLTLCGLPQVYTTLKTKTTKGLSLGMLLTWHIGGVLTGIYILFTSGQGPLLFNYGLNTLVTTTLLVLYYRYKSN